MITRKRNTKIQSTASASVTTVDAIINPAAGGGSARRRWPEIERALTQRGVQIRRHVTTAPGDATVFARRIAETGGDTIACVGGDGTVNEVVNGLIVDDQPVSPNIRLSVMPCGTGGDLGRVLGTRNLDSALQALMQGTTAQIDVGRMQYLNAQTDHLDARYFINVADTGIGAATAQRVNASSMRFGGLVSYLGAAVQTIAGFKPWNAVVEVDGHEIFAGPVGMVVFANSRYFAGGMLVAPDASLCDGLLDIFVLEGIGKRPMLTSLLPRVYQGKHVGRPGVTHVTGATASVRSSDGMLIEMDGELVGRTPVSASVVPRVLRVVGLAAILNNAGGCANAGP